jgi:hypothetical protein
MLGMPTSRPPSHLKLAEIDAPPDGQLPNLFGPDFKWLDVPLSDYPFVLAMPHFVRPGILTGAEKSEGVGLRGFQVIGPSVSLPEVDAGRQVIALSPTLPHELLRMVAKIAHGAAVAELGIDAFEAFLPPVILGQSPYVGHYVGHRDIVCHSDKLHWIGLERVGDYWVAYVHLFALKGGAPFEVVIGRDTALGKKT